jgi:hypothetical protein
MDFAQRPGCLRRFLRPRQGLCEALFRRNTTRAGKMRRSNGAGMKHSGMIWLKHSPSRLLALKIAAKAATKRKQACHAKLPLFYSNNIFEYWTCSITRLVISQVLRFFRLKPGFSLAKPRFLAEVVQKLKFPNNSIIISTNYCQN